LSSRETLCDVDLQRLVRYHLEKSADVTIGLKSVDNPLEFGIVVTDEDGRIERFLEKPSWGQVFSDTINTGIYVLNPEVMRHVPTDRPYDFAKELFPPLEMGARSTAACSRLLAGHREPRPVPPGELRRPRGKVALISESSCAATSGSATRTSTTRPGRGPAFIGNNCGLARGERQPNSFHRSELGARERARIERSVIDRHAHRRGAVVEARSDARRPAPSACRGRRDRRRVSIGAERHLPGRSHLPHKEVESGAQILELIWVRARACSAVTESELINVDLTRWRCVSARAGTSLKRARESASREAPAPPRSKRALITGVLSTGVDVADLRVLPSAVNRHLLKSGEFDAGCTSASTRPIES
jgi:mannose-1-phosphate guanylyltransferase/phosphomannomutase